MYSGCWINNQNGETRVGEDSLEDLEQRRARLYDQLAATGDFRRGSISENYRRCGKPNCVCARGSPRAWAAIFVDAHGGRAGYQGAAALGRGGGQGARRVGQLSPFRAGQ